MEIQFVKAFIDPGVRVYESGDVAEMSDARAHNMIHHGIAIPIVRLQPPAVETAVVPEVIETAVVLLPVEMPIARRSRKEKRRNA
jgi:hypothetical protein